MSIVSNIKLETVVEGDLKAPFSVAAIEKGVTLFLDPLYPQYILYCAES